MSKTIPIDDSTHEIIIQKQNELRKIGIYVKISDIADMAIKNGINSVNDEVVKRVTK